MGAENECLGCGVGFDYDESVCPERGWDPQDFSARDRYGLAKPGHADRDGGPGGPPRGPRGLF